MTDRTEALREEIARAWCASGGFDPDEMMPNDGPRWKYYLDGADAILPIITLEAEVARKDEALRKLVDKVRRFNGVYPAFRSNPPIAG